MARTKTKGTATERREIARSNFARLLAGATLWERYPRGKELLRGCSYFFPTPPLSRKGNAAFLPRKRERAANSTMVYNSLSDAIRTGLHSFPAMHYLYCAILSQLLSIPRLDLISDVMYRYITTCMHGFCFSINLLLFFVIYAFRAIFIISRSEHFFVPSVSFA